MCLVEFGSLAEESLWLSTYIQQHLPGGAYYSYMYLCVRRDWGPEMSWRCRRPPVGFGGVLVCFFQLAPNPKPSSSP